MLRGRRRSRGQALVEFALIAPFFFLMFFGIVEVALFTSTVGAFDYATREGARTGSVIGRTGAGASCPGTPATTDGCIVSAVVNRTGGLVFGQATQIAIYRANPVNDSPAYQCLDSSGNGTSLSSSSCEQDIYSLPWNSTACDPTTATAPNCTWPVNSRDDFDLNADYLGVQVLYKYSFATSFIASTGTVLNLSASSVERIEPQDFSRRSGGGGLAARRGDSVGPVSQPGHPGARMDAVAVLPSRRGNGIAGGGTA